VAGSFKITPQAVWEEELEEEQLEIREPERLEMMEVIDGEEDIDTPVKDVVGHLLRGGEHPNPVVNEFRYKWLTDGSKDYYQALNRVLYDGMRGRDAWETYDDTTLSNLLDAAFNATYNPRKDDHPYVLWFRSHCQLTKPY